MQVNERDIIFPVSELYIKIDSNVGESLQSFNRGMIKLPKMSTAPIMTSDTPFFTRYVRYPSDIESADWKTRFEFFFDRDTFVDRLRREIANDPSIFKDPNKAVDVNAIDSGLEDWLIETEKHNIMVMLRSIFPIPNKFKMALKNSYDHYILNRSNERIIYDIDLLDSINFFEFMNKFGIINKEKEEYFLNVNGKRYEIEDVNWTNDIINHKEYLKFLKTQHNTYESLKNSKSEVNKKLAAFIEDLNDNLNQSAVDWDKKQRFINAFYLSTNQENHDEMQGLYKEQYHNSKLSDDKLPADFYAFFSKRFKQENEDSLRKYVYDDKGKMFESVLKILESYKIPNPEEDGTVKTQVYNLFTQKNTIPDIERIIDFKSKKTKYDLEKSRSISDKTKKETEIQVQSMDRIIEKLNRIISGERGERSADLFIAISEIIEDSSRIGRLFNTDEKSYEGTLKALISLSIKLKAAIMMSDFVNNGKQIKLGSPDPKDPTKQKMTQTENDISKELNLEFGDQLFTNNQLIDAVKNVYEPVRRTSNLVLYGILYKIKTGKFPKDAEKNAAIMEKINATISDTSLFKKIYDYYLAKYPDRSEFGKIEHALYTGVDQTRSSGSNNKSDIKRSSYEIYVRLELVDADQLTKTPRGICKLNDRIVANNYGELTDPKYFDGATVSDIAYRLLNIDEALPEALTKQLSDNPLVKDEKIEKQPPPPAPKQLPQNKNDDYTGGKRTRNYSRNVRGKGYKQKTLRKNRR